MAVHKLNTSVGISGRFLGFETKFYMDSDKNAACLINLDDEGLDVFLGLFDEAVKQRLYGYVDELGKFNIDVLVWYGPDGFDIDVDIKNIRFIIHSGDSGKLLLFDYGRHRAANLIAEICKGVEAGGVLTDCVDNNGSIVNLFSTTSAFDNILDFLGIKDLMFCYVQGSPSGDRLEDVIRKHGLSIPRYRSKADSAIIFYAKVDVRTLRDGLVKESLSSEIFSTHSLDLYIEVNQGGFNFKLLFPVIHMGLSPPIPSQSHHQGQSEK